MQLLQGNCLELMKQIPDRSIDLVVTDCPYHIVQGGCTNDAVKIGRYTATNNNAEMTKRGKLFEHNDIEFSEWLPDVYRVLKDGTHCYIMINPRNIKELQQCAEDVGFVFQNILVWDKGNCTPNRYNINNMGTKNILRIPNITRKKLHPTEKPVELFDVLISNSSNENEVVLDPFMGVGGAGISAKNLNRDFIGIELDENYFEIAKQEF